MEAGGWEVQLSGLLEAKCICHKCATDQPSVSGEMEWLGMSTELE